MSCFKQTDTVENFEAGNYFRTRLKCVYVLYIVQYTYGSVSEKMSLRYIYIKVIKIIHV